MSRQPGVYAVRVGDKWIMADFDGAFFTCERGPIDEVGDRIDLADGLNRLKAKWQADALEGVLVCCRKLPPGDMACDILRVVDQMARARRTHQEHLRQAEGENHE